VLLVHALLALALWSVRTPELRSPAVDARTLPITVWLPALAVPLPVPPRVPVRSSVATVRRAALPAAPETPAAPVVAAAPSTAITLDWQGELKGAAERSAAKPAQDAAKATFSPPPRPLQAPCKPPPSAFRFESEKPPTWGNLRGIGQEKEEAYSHLFDDMKAGDRPDADPPCAPAKAGGTVSLGRVR